MITQVLSKSLSVMAHTTTTIAFGTAIWGLLFPAQAADYVARVMEELQGARASLVNIDTNTATTADATTALADRMADRPRFGAQSFVSTRNAPANAHQFQMTLENLTDASVNDLVIIVTALDGQMMSNLLANTIPPFETHLEISTGVPDFVCYGYEWNGQYYSETRTLEITSSPVLDQMGNAGTFGYNHFGYDLVTEPDADSFTCGTQTYTRSALRARQGEIDATGQ